MPILLTIVGLVLGVALDRHGGWLYGSLAGLALGLSIGMRRRLRELELEVARLRRAQGITPATVEKLSPAEPTPKPKPESVVEPEPGQEPDAEAEQPFIIDHWNEPQPRERESAAAFTLPTWLEAPWQSAKDWLLGGNIMVRVGVVVLFFGVAFLLKFAADNALLPIEFRLAGVAVAGIFMLVLGWRVRDSKRIFGLAMQGGAVGVLYLTVFAALRLYSLIPPSMAFAVLAAFAAFSAALAVLQNAQGLAVLAAAGGFLAPILTSTGEGSHVQLFSYYLLLNLGILGIAWFRAWRLLNLVGFAFTFVIASLWGAQYYRPELFDSTEPFLILFSLLYVAVSVLFAFRRPVDLRGYVDATLVFGVPLVGFALQAALVHGMENALAWSALIAAGFYVVLAWLLFKRLGKDSRLLAEAFLAIGVVFATLAVPLALDARWTAGMWALEGAAMVWVGGRQGQLVPRLFGYLLQLGAGAAFVHSAQVIPPNLPVLNGIFIGALIIALAGLFTALHLQRHAPVDSHESLLRRPLFLWGIAWWYGAWLFEIDEQVHYNYQLLALGLFFTATGLAAHELRQRLDWPAMRYPTRGLLPSLFLLLPFAALWLEHPFENWGWLAWSAGLMVHIRMLSSEDDSDHLMQYWHMGGLWLVLTLFSWETAWMLDEAVQGADTWWRIAWGLVPAAALAAMMRFGERLPSPVADHPDLYLDKALIPVGFYLWAWILVLCLGSRGAADPLPYLPLLNPMDIAVGIVTLIMVSWLYPGSENEDGKRIWRFPHANWALALTLFAWLNTAWFRTAHHWLQVSFSPDAMLDSQTVQAGLAMLWGLVGLGCMTMGARQKSRQLWFVGAGLMAVVVLKLFLVDLSNTRTMARIVSFLSVGVLLLVVGYFSPIPPRQKQEEDS